MLPISTALPKGGASSFSLKEQKKSITFAVILASVQVAPPLGLGVFSENNSSKIQHYSICYVDTQFGFLENSYLCFSLTTPEEQYY